MNEEDRPTTAATVGGSARAYKQPDSGRKITQQFRAYI